MNSFNQRQSLYYFYCMKTILKPIVKLKESYQQVLQAKPEIHPVPLNLKLLFNPFLKGEQKYKMINHQLTLYNKRIANYQITDQYEVKSFDQLFIIMSEVGNMDTREDQLNRLNETVKWWNQQRRIIKQRKQLGVVKYKTDRQIDKLRDYQDKLSKSHILKEDPPILPNQIRYSEIFPFQMNYRTSHKQMDVPIKRLTYYKRKITNINDNSLLETDIPSAKGEKVTYPMPKKIQPPEELNQDQQAPLNPQNAEQSAVQTTEAQAGSIAANSQNPKVQVKAEGVVDEASKRVPQEAQDLNMGFGEEPAQQEQQGGQEEPQEDKLAPRNKIYTWSNKQRYEYQSGNKYEKPYMFYKGNDVEIQRRMEQRTIKKQQYSLQLQREEKDLIKRAHQWAEQKSKIEKQMQYKLQNLAVNHSFAFSYEEPEKKEMLSQLDQKKYGFSIPLRSIGAKKQIDMSNKLPEAAQFKPIEKQIRKDRLKSLKHKFATILNIKENAQQKDVNTASMCQTSPQRRNFSMILQEHSLQKQKMLELQQIQKIKESLGKYRININMRTLAQALVPDSENYRSNTFVSPPKLLPNNPFFVQPKKKKKK